MQQDARDFLTFWTRCHLKPIPNLPDEARILDEALRGDVVADALPFAVAEFIDQPEPDYPFAVRCEYPCAEQRLNPRKDAITTKPIEEVSHWHFTLTDLGRDIVGAFKRRATPLRRQADASSLCSNCGGRGEVEAFASVTTPCPHGCRPVHTVVRIDALGDVSSHQIMDGLAALGDANEDAKRRYLDSTGVRYTMRVRDTVDWTDLPITVEVRADLMSYELTEEQMLAVNIAPEVSLLTGDLTLTQTFDGVDANIERPADPDGALAPTMEQVREAFDRMLDQQGQALLGATEDD